MKLEWTEPAVLDLESLRDYIAKDSAYYAAQFVARIIEAAEPCRTIPASEGPFPLIMRHLDKTTDPILASRHAVNALTIMVAGLIAVAVANKEVIAHPQGQTLFALSLLLAGGPILFLAAKAGICG